MPFKDLQQELQQLGYGNQWQQVQQKLAIDKEEVNAQDLKRVKQHNQRFPEKHKAAKTRWAQKRFDQIKDRIGKQKCDRCFNVMQTHDLIGQNRLRGHCKKCRKELLG